MSSDSFEDILGVLNNIFEKCDTDGNGIVKIDTLLDVLASHVPSWQADQTMKEEFRNLFLCNETSDLISKNHFVNSLLDWFDSSYSEEKDTGGDEQMSTGASEKCSVSAFESEGSSSEVLSDSSSNSVKNTNPVVYYVSDGQSLTNEDIEDTSSTADSDSPCSSRKLLMNMESEINSLQRRNEHLETTNKTCQDQILLLEEVLAQNDKELAANLKKLTGCNQDLEMHKLKLNEAEEKLNLVVEEKKSVIMQLSQCESEISRLNESILKREKQIEIVMMEKMQQDNKLKQLEGRLKLLSDLNNNIQEEIDHLKLIEQSDKEKIEEMAEQNANLQSLLESSTLVIQDLKAEVTSAYKELSSIQNSKVKATMASDSVSNDPSPNSSMIFFDDNFPLDNTIPFETSLLSELQRKENEMRLSVQYNDVGVNCKMKAMTLKRKILSRMGLSQRQRSNLP